MDTPELILMILVLKVLIVLLIFIRIEDKVYAEATFKTRELEIFSKDTL